MMGLLSGPQFVIVPPQFVRRQFRFPRSKRKRIQKKWTKNATNWRSHEVPWNGPYRVGRVLYVSAEQYYLLARIS